MKLEAICHRTSDNYCYPLNEEALIINIKTGYDVEKVYLVYGDPFDAGILGGNWKWQGGEEEITQKKDLNHHIWWTTTVNPEFKRCKYYFKLITEDEAVYYFEDGFYTEEEIIHEEKNLVCFTFPWMNPIDINRTPKWVNDTVWYQIFPERFCDGDPSNNPVGTKPWNSKRVSNEESYGGDLQGIINQLDYLVALGINGIYMTPIFEADSSHKYDTIDYLNIDPQFGDEKLFKELVKIAHEKGIKIMIDGVFNHSGKRFRPWLDVLEKGPDSKYYKWFMINKWPLEKKQRDTRDGAFYSFAFIPDMPKLNTNNQEVIDYLLKVVRIWIENYDIDGLRLDVANEISHRFCKDLRRLTRDLKPDFYLLGEIWHDSISWLRGDEFDAVMNYPLATSITEFWSFKDRTSRNFEHSINRNFTMYMEQTNDVLFNLLDSHDTNRLINKVKDLDVFYQQLTLLYTMPGSPCIYYGTEIALEGSYDPDCRRCMPWEAIEAGRYDDTIGVVKQLIAIRKSIKALRSREYFFIHEEDHPRIIRYIKKDDEFKKVEVILNCSEVAFSIKDKDKVLFSHLYNGYQLEPNGICILDSME